MQINRPPSFQINFLTCFYVLNAGLAHKQVTWAWEEISRSKQIKGWYTFYQDIADKPPFIIDSVMSLWIFFSFLAALFPHFKILRFGTFIGYFGTLILQGKPDGHLFGFFIEIFPLFFFAFIPNSLLFSGQILTKIIQFFRKKAVKVKNVNPKESNDQNTLSELCPMGSDSFFTGYFKRGAKFLNGMKIYHFLLLLPLFIVIYHSFQEYFFYKQLFFLLTSLCVVIQIPESFSCSMVFEKLSKVFIKGRSH